MYRIATKETVKATIETKTSHLLEFSDKELAALKHWIGKSSQGDRVAGGLTSDEAALVSDVYWFINGLGIE